MYYKIVFGGGERVRIGKHNFLHGNGNYGIVFLNSAIISSTLHFKNSQNFLKNNFHKTCYVVIIIESLSSHFKSTIIKRRCLVWLCNWFILIDVHGSTLLLHTLWSKLLRIKNLNRISCIFNHISNKESFSKVQIIDICLSLYLST